MATVLDPTPATKLTPDDLLRLPDQGKGFELVDGELVEQNVSTLSSYVAGQSFGKLLNVVQPAGLGWVFRRALHSDVFKMIPIGFAVPTPHSFAATG